VEQFDFTQVPTDREIVGTEAQRFCHKPFVSEFQLPGWGVLVAEELVFKGRHFDRSVILLCVRWYLAYNLSLRNLEEMMAERGISGDHATIHRWTVHYAPLLMEQFNRRKRPVTGRWHVDETYIKVRGQWWYLYRAIDSNGDTVEFWFSERRNLTAAKRFLRKAMQRHGRPTGS
jgi:transposase-like protein